MDSPRGEMLEDLCENHLKPGMTQKQISDLLGKPDEVILNPSERYGMEVPARHVFWDYEIGWWSGFRMDSDHLILDFDPAGKVYTYWGEQH